MDVDIILEPDLNAKQIVELGTAAEKYGIRAVWTSNFFAHWDPFLTLCALANETDKLKLGALAVSPFEQHPLKIANSLLSLNELSNGRAMVAIGAGEGNLDAMDLKTPPKIVKAVREAVEIVVGAGSGALKESGYKGDIFNVNYPCAYDWLEAPAPTVYVAAYRHMMMRMGGRVADGVFIGCTPVEIVEPAVENIKIGVSKRDKPVDNFPINSFWAWHIKEDREEAYRESRRELAWRARKLDPELITLFVSEEEAKFVHEKFDTIAAAWFDRSGNIKDFPIELAHRLCEGFTSTGGLEDLDREMERFKKFGQAGQNQISIRLHDDPMDALKIIGERVVPVLRDI